MSTESIKRPPTPPMSPFDGDDWVKLPSFNTLFHAQHLDDYQNKSTFTTSIVGRFDTQATVDRGREDSVLLKTVLDLTTVQGAITRNLQEEGLSETYSLSIREDENGEAPRCDERSLHDFVINFLHIQNL